MTRRIAEQSAVLFFGDREVYRPDAAATLSRSSLGSFAVDGHRGNYSFQVDAEMGEISSIRSRFGRQRSKPSDIP